MPKCNNVVCANCCVWFCRVCLIVFFFFFFFSNIVVALTSLWVRLPHGHSQECSWPESRPPTSCSKSHALRWFPVQCELGVVCCAFLSEWLQKKVFSGVREIKKGYTECFQTENIGSLFSLTWMRWTTEPLDNWREKVLTRLVDNKRIACHSNIWKNVCDVCECISRLIARHSRWIVQKRH